MEIDENLKYTLYVTHASLDPFSFTNLDILAFNSILVPVQENQWYLVARQTTSCRYEKKKMTCNTFKVCCIPVHLTVSHLLNFPQYSMNYFHFPLLLPHDWIVHGTLNILFSSFFRAYSKTPSSTICFIPCLLSLVYAEKRRVLELGCSGPC